MRSGHSQLASLCSSFLPSRLFGASTTTTSNCSSLHQTCSSLSAASSTLKLSRPTIHQKRCYSNQTRAALQIELIPCLKDNYAYLVHDTKAGITGVIDPSESEPVIKALKKNDLHLAYILNTHHHWDHTGGNMALKGRYNAKVVGPYADRDRIPGIDIALKDGEKWMFGTEEMLAIDTPGHTRGHICYSFPSSNAIFTGDTLFSLSCGRLFEGTPKQMWASLSKIASMPAETLVYCGHEYTLSNAEFALTLEPGNESLRSYYEKIKGLRQDGLPTIPTSLALESSCNPFLRLSSSELRASLGIAGDASELQVLAAVRAAKDRW